MPDRTSERPYSLELERALLGGLILNPGRLSQIGALVGVSDLYRPDHAEIYGLLLEMHAAGDPIEPVTVAERVSHGGIAGRCGGIPYVVELADHAPSTANLDYYARRVAALARWREVMGAAERLMQAADAAPADIEQGVDNGFVLASLALAALAPLASPEARTRALTGLAVAAGRDAAVTAFRAAFPKGAP